MKPITLVLCFFSFSIFTHAQIKAVTSNGDEVILNADGTWKYLNDSVTKPSVIETNPTIFQKSVNASFLVKSNKVSCGVYINPKKWTFSKDDDREATEFQFVLKGKDAYCMLITEKMEMPIESLKQAALANARSVAPGITVEKEEFRNVNGIKVLMMQMRGKVQGIDFVYFGYYFCSAIGTIQLITYTSGNLLSEYKADMEELLNGFVIIDNKK